MMKPINMESLAQVAHRLEPLNKKFAFLGGAVVPLLIDNPSLVASHDFIESLSGHLLPDSASQARLPALRETLERIASMR